MRQITFIWLFFKPKVNPSWVVFG